MASTKGGQTAAKVLAAIGVAAKKAESVRVGFLASAKYPDGTSVAMVAAIQEFGAPKVRIPPRPFMRNTVAKYKDEWPDAIANLLVENNYDAIKTLRIVGEVVKGQMQQEIVDTNAPSLSPVTLMLRKMRSQNPNLVVTGKTVGEAAARVKAGKSYAGVSTKPLIYTDTMYKSVDFEVK
jgi:hypothetical protein